MQYLVAEGYKVSFRSVLIESKGLESAVLYDCQDAAEEFEKDTGIHPEVELSTIGMLQTAAFFSTLTTVSPSRSLERSQYALAHSNCSIGDRMAIRNAIQDGDIPRAIEKVCAPLTAPQTHSRHRVSRQTSNTEDTRAHARAHKQ